MKKKKNIKTVIRQIVREEVAMAIHEVITELKQPTQKVTQPKSKKKVVEKKEFTKNSILNDVLNETAESDEWKTLGGDTFNSNKMNQVMSGQYSDVMNNNSQAPITVDGQTPDFLKKDYRKLMKAIDKKQGKS